MTSSTNRASLIERLEAIANKIPDAVTRQRLKDEAALIREMDELLFESLYHLRVDGAAKAYHEKVEALRAKASKS